MSTGDEKLPWGAAAPAARRRIESQPVLDAIWVLVVAAVVLLSSWVDLVELPTTRVRTSDWPAGFAAVVLPCAAIVVALAGMARRSVAVVAAALGMLVPGVALAGSMAALLFLSEVSAFADAGVAVSFVAAIAGAVMLVRWFVYHPIDLLTEEPRPIPIVARALIGVGFLLVGVVVVDWFRSSVDGASASRIVDLAFALLLPLAVIIAGTVRSRDAFVVAAFASASSLGAQWIFGLPASNAELVGRPGVGVLVLLGLASAVAVVGTFVDALDDPTVIDSAEDIGSESWRWNPDD